MPYGLSFSNCIGRLRVKPYLDVHVADHTATCGVPAACTSCRSPRRASSTWGS